MLSSRLQQVINSIGIQSIASINVIVKVRQISSSVLSDLEKRGLKITNVLEPNFVSGISPANRIKEIDSSPYVSEVHYDETVTGQVDGISLLSDENIFITPDNAGLRLNIGNAYSSGIYGRGVVIAEIDSGVNSFHPMISGALLRQYGSQDQVGHGTHVAGIACGRKVTSPEGTIRGIAPEADLVSFNALGDGTGSISDVVKAINIVNTDYKPKIVMMSLGRAYDCGGTCPLCQTIDSFSDRIIFSLATGNFGPNKKTIACPATSRGAVAVGSIDLNGNPSSFSSRGTTVDGRTKPDIVEFGGNDNEYIYSAVAGKYDKNKTGFVGLKGTSMAQPFHAGIEALLLSGEGSQKSVTEILKLLAGGSKNTDTGYGLFRFKLGYKPKVN